MRLSFLTSVFLLFGLISFGVPGAARGQDMYVVNEQGRGTWRAMFDRKMDTPSEQWEYARATQNRGALRKADRRMLYLVRQWPSSREAPWAARARADMLFARGKLDDAFEAYQFLIDNYSSRMQDYDSVLQNQFNIASNLMDKRRLRWLFGGYRVPEYAVEYFEKVIRNGPQWSRAAEAQFLIGKCHQEAGELELAISAYSLVGYRYPESLYAQTAAWQQIICLQEVSEEFPNSSEARERILTATTVYLSTYPDSEHRVEVIELRNGLYEVMASQVHEKATFYADVARKPRAAILYDKTLIEEYPKSRLVPEAEERASMLEALLNKPEESAQPVPARSKPLPFG